jgi:peptidoglycan/LPS O-acetylase OafA/YrhL
MKRLYSLDAIRGLAALTIVIWHWQHFFALSGHWQEGWLRASQPFYRLLEPLYLEAWAAVDLFFALSGFVFFWLYREAIRERKVAPGKFALLRFSRLWPLHALMLVTVGLLQMAFHAKTGGYFIFPADAPDRFFANLFLVQQWLPLNSDQTFNGPAWTVSVECGLYVVFFLLCRLGLNGWKSAAIVALAGLALYNWNEMVGRGMMGFFLGGLSYFAVEKIRTFGCARRVSVIIGGLCLAVWAVVLIEIEFGPLHQGLVWVTDRLPDDWYDPDKTDAYFHIAYIFTAVPLTVIALALSEAVLNLFPRFYQKTTYLGDISYGVYMIHFPLQTACALTAVSIGLTPMFFMHWWAMAGFYVVLLGLASLSYFFFEKPVQKWIRGMVEKTRLSSPTEERERK